MLIVKRNKMKQLTAVILLMAFLIGCKSDESVLLRLRFKKGDEQTFIIHVKAKCSASTYLDSRIEASYIADSVINDSQYYLTSKINAVKTDIKGELMDQNVEVHYDSRKSLVDMGQAERDMDSKLDKLISSYYNITFNEKGEAEKPFTVFGKEVLQPFGPALVQLSFPVKRVKVGDSWTVKIKNPFTNPTTNLISSDVTFNYVVDNITKDNVIIDVQLDIDFNGDASKHMQGKGNYTIDRVTGRTLEGYISTPMNGCDEDILISIIKDTPQNFDY
jgi:hypothetical protein